MNRFFAELHITSFNGCKITRPKIVGVRAQMLGHGYSNTIMPHRRLTNWQSDAQTYFNF